MSEDKKLGPFDIINSLSTGDRNIAGHKDFNSAYIPFVINRHLSYFADTILIANIANQMSNLDSEMQFNFLINTVKPMKRYSKWAKREVLPDIELIKRYYNLNETKARETLKVLTPEQVASIREMFDEVLNE